jgi:hypothetical protein
MVSGHSGTYVYFRLWVREAKLDYIPVAPDFTREVNLWQAFKGSVFDFMVGLKVMIFILLL